MPRRKRRQKRKGGKDKDKDKDKQEANIVDDENADYFGDVDAEVDEDTRGPDNARFSEELKKKLAKRKRLKELKEVVKGSKRLEAKDHGTDVWYQAKIVEFDDSENEVLIHFENWSQRYDEWILIDSPRLRLLAEEPVQPVQTKPTKPTKPFRVGEKVMATWNDSRKYPAEIKAIVSKGVYKVLFYDGFVKDIKGHRITKLAETNSQLRVRRHARASNPKSKSAPQRSNTSRTNLEPKYSKEERRLRMRKLNIAELFQTNRRRRRRKGGNSDNSDSDSDAQIQSRQKSSKLTVSDSENSGLESPWQSRLLDNDNDSDMCDRVEAEHRRQRTSSSPFGVSDIETRSMTRRMSSSSLGESDVENRARTRRMSSSPFQGGNTETKIRRQRMSSSPLGGSDIETRSMTRRMSLSSFGGSDIENKITTRSPFVSSDDTRTTQKTSSCHLEGSDIEARTGRGKTSTSQLGGSDDETRVRTRRASLSPCGGSDRETRSMTRRTSLSPYGVSDRETRSTTRRTSSSPCVGSDVETIINTRRKSSSPTRSRGQARTPLGYRDVEPRTRSRTRSPFGDSDIVRRARSASHMESETSESDIDLTKNYRKCVSEGEIDSMQSQLVPKRRRRRRKPWGKTLRRKERAESSTDLSSCSDHSAAESEIGPTLRVKDWAGTTQSVAEKNVSDEITNDLATVCIRSEKLPPGWSKYAVQRKPGYNDKWNVYYVSPDGQKLLKKIDLIHYKSHFPVPEYEFSFRPKDHSELIEDVRFQSINEPQVRAELVSATQGTSLTEKVLPKTLKTLLPKKQTNEESMPSPAGAVLNVTLKSVKGEEPAGKIINGTMVIGNLKIFIKDSQYCCPETKCQKRYQKRKSFMLHVQRNHPDCYRLSDTQNTDGPAQDEIGESISSQTTANFEVAANDKLNSEELLERTTPKKETFEKKATGTRNFMFTMNFTPIVEEEEEQEEVGIKDSIERNRKVQKEYQNRKREAEKEFVKQGPSQLSLEELAEIPLPEPTELPDRDANELPCHHQKLIQQPEPIEELVQNVEFEGNQKAHLEKESSQDIQMVSDQEMELSQNREIKSSQAVELSQQESGQEIELSRDIDIKPDQEMELCQNRVVEYDQEMELCQPQDLNPGQERGLHQSRNLDSDQEMELGSEHESESGPESEHNTLQLCELETGRKHGHQQECETEASWEPELEDAEETEPESTSELEPELDPNHCTDSCTTVNDEFSESAQGDSSQDGANSSSPTVKTLLPIIRLQKLEEDKQLGSLPIVQKVLLEQQRQHNEAGDDSDDQTGCETENRVQQTHGKSSHLKRLLDCRLAHAKKRKLGIKYPQKTSLEERTSLSIIVESEDSLEPNPEPVSEQHQRSPVVHLEKITSSVDSNESGLDERSQMSSTSDTQQSKESSVREDIINCSCGSQEEHGLMVQCDICLCWQHGFCNSIQVELDVPEKYVCTFCLNPPLERQAKKYSHSQDWLLSGTLSRLSVASSDKQDQEEYAELLKTSHELLSALIRLKKAVWATRVKAESLCRLDQSKLNQWNEKWDCYTEVPTDEDNDANEKSDDTIVNEDDNAIDETPVLLVKEDNEDIMIDPKEEGEYEGGEDGLAEDGISEDEISEDGISEDGLGDYGLGEEGVEDEGVEDEGVEDEGVEEEGVGEDGLVEDRLEEDGTGEDGVVAEDIVGEDGVVEDRAVEDEGGENVEGKHGVLNDVLASLSSCSSTESLNSVPAPFKTVTYVQAEDSCGHQETDRILEAGSATECIVPEDVNTEQDSLISTDASFMTAESSFQSQELSFLSPDVPTMHAGANSLVTVEKRVLHEDYEVLSQTVQDFLSEEEEPLLNDGKSENVGLKSLCETCGENKGLSEKCSHSAEKCNPDREECSVSEDLKQVDKPKTHDKSSTGLIKKTEDKKCTAISSLDMGNNCTLLETETKSTSVSRPLTLVEQKMGTSVQIGVDECSTAQQVLSSERGMRVRTIKTDPKITVQLVENVPSVSMETEKGKSVVVLQAGNDKPTLQNKWSDIDEPVQSDRNESDAAFHVGRSECAKKKHDSLVHAMKDIHDGTMQAVRNKAGVQIRKTQLNVTAKEIKEQGVTKSVPQRKFETSQQTIKNHNDGTTDTLLKDKASSENTVLREGSHNTTKSASTGSESQCREQDSYTSINTDLSELNNAQTEMANENGDDAGNDSPDSFDRILNALKTGSESVSCQENLSSDPDFESELAMLEETVHSIESDSCGPSGLELVQNNSNPLGPPPHLASPRGNKVSVNNYGTVQYEAVMDNARDAIVSNILNQTSEQCIKEMNPVNINAAPVIFEDLVLRDVEPVHDRVKSSETSDLQLPMDAAQILQLADSMEESLCSSDSERHQHVPATGPQPEALIETDVCRKNLAYHIAEEHKKLMQVLDAAEEQVKDLESKCMDESEKMRPTDIQRRMKKIIKILNLVNGLTKQDSVQSTKNISDSK
ncbi:uncharacterized protein LOC126470566 isoform X2 [Schistocerca serialis cubense]|uniref:uncharacterized protein LOC126470566 isoform X2 n=1 Tax=Schistocerca serialis cubense TaxID=2023355 RepID=UPI00214E9C48|nr:uncharacterized protein LOC126470566 isoform X2 [Schistocerca serialis cubense]